MVKYEDIYESKFSFGKNWIAFLKNVNDERIKLSQNHLMKMLGEDSIKGKTFLDVGCGSGLHSLSAVLLGAKKVHSFDADSNSIVCSKLLRDKYKVSPELWVIEHASVLDEGYLNTLPKFDIVYSWGVLHHTGEMMKSIDLTAAKTNNKGLLYLALYNNYKGFPSSNQWEKIKRFYGKSSKPVKRFLEITYMTKNILSILLKKKNPIKHIRQYPQNSLRGMSFYYDVVDWLGGYPYATISPFKMTQIMKNKNYELISLKENKGTGCNEFIFKKNAKWLEK